MLMISMVIKLVIFYWLVLWFMFVSYVKILRLVIIFIVLWFVYLVMSLLFCLFFLNGLMIVWRFLFNVCWYWFKIKIIYYLVIFLLLLVLVLWFFLKMVNILRNCCLMLILLCIKWKMWVKIKLFIICRC